MSADWLQDHACHCGSISVPEPGWHLKIDSQG